MAETKLLGKVKCPLWYCGEPDAEIREGEKGKAYLVCGECGSLLRSPIGKAQRAMRALVAAAPASPPPPKKKDEPEKAAPAAPAAKDKPQRGAGFF